MLMLHDCRWDPNPEAVHLDDLPHKVLTQPAKVFEFSFDGLRKTRGRDNLVKLQAIAEGMLNAVAFWFDLHLDVEVSITSGMTMLYCNSISEQQRC